MVNRRPGCEHGMRILHRVKGARRPAAATSEPTMTIRIPPDLLGQCLVLAGPTASGKTELALEWAEATGAEIVAMDSMSLYRGMTIGTAKATPQEQARVPHHLLDILDPYQDFSVADYVEAAAAACKTIVAAGRVPLFAGGTGLYLRGLLRGVFDGPPADWDIRERLESEAAQQPRGWLWSQLEKTDPQSAGRLHPHDTRRLVRALEVHELTGRPLSEQQDQGPAADGVRPRQVLWLSPPRDWLYPRINRRVDEMVENGLVGEVQGLLQSDPSPGRTARQALGYKEIIDHLEGRISLEEAVDTIKRHTRRFARKQTTWFRNLEECRELKLSGQERPEELLEHLVADSDPQRQ
jgi:tRNA dimethylallyltransferase